RHPDRGRHDDDRVPPPRAEARWQRDVMLTERTIDRLRGDADGPTLIIVGGMHGNEPAGVEAARVVLERVRRAGCEVRGELVALRGNVRALLARRRYLSRDLNRLWTPDRVATART